MGKNISRLRVCTGACIFATRFQLLELLMTRLVRRKAWLAAGISTVLPAVLFGPIIAGTEPVVICHTLLMLTLQSGTNGYPNIQNSSIKSREAIQEEAGISLGTYSYIPGLEPTDPHDLVLFYVNRPTRHICHDDWPTLFRPRRWIIVPPDFVRGRGEHSDWVKKEVFCRRLQKTLRFLEEHRRPGWKEIVEEHSRFLKEIDCR